MKGLIKKVLVGLLSSFMVMSNMTFVQANTTTGKNLKQQSIATIENMPNLPKGYKLIDWLERGRNLHNFIFDYTATDFSKNTELSVKEGRTFSTIYRDDKYGGYMIPAFYGENRPIVDRNDHDGEDDQESIAIVSALIAASLMGIDMNKELPDVLKGNNTIVGGYQINTYLDNALKYFWNGKGDVFTNVPNGSESKLQNMANVSNAYGDFWYLLIANQNFFRLAELNPNWRTKEVLELQEKVADKMVEMVDILMQTEDKFNIQCFDFEHMGPLENSRWRQPDSAVGTANILYYAYKIFKDKDSKQDKAQVYLEHAKTCMKYLDDLTYNPYYENMLIDAVYLSTMMNAEQGTNYNTTKYLEWITTPTRSSVRNWGGVNYTQDGIDVYGMTGEPNNGYCYFFNSIYPMTSILPAAKYDPSYARMAGKWAINIVNASRYFLPTEWSKEHQTDGNYIGKLEGDVMAYESLKKNSDGHNFYATGDAKRNATSGWMAGANTTNFGLYGGVYTGYLGALVEETNVEGILKLDCNKTDYYQNDMYETYLYYNPYMEIKNVEIDLGNQCYDIYDSVTGTYLAKNVTGKQEFKMLADSARVIVLTDANSTVQYKNDGTTLINGKLVVHSTSEILPDQGEELISNITINGLDEINQRGQTTSYEAIVSPSEDLMDSRIIWTVTDVNGNKTDKATITDNGVLTVKKNGQVIVKASSIDGSGTYGTKLVTITGQTLASLSQDKKTTVSSTNDNNGGNLAVDGNVTTRWIANASEEHPWIYVDLGYKADIDLIILNWEAARPHQYDIQVSDDLNNWQTIKSIDTRNANDNDTNKTVRLEFNGNEAGRYVRIDTQKKSKYGCSLYEFDVYGGYQNIENMITSIQLTAENNIQTITTKNKPLQMIATIMPENASDKRVEWFVYNEDGTDTTKAEITSTGKLIPLENGVVKVIARAVDGSNTYAEYKLTLENQDRDNLALNKTVYVSNQEKGNPKERAVDGSTETRWASGTKDNNQWITIDLGDIYNIDKVVLYWESYAKKYKIQGSLDNQKYTDFYVKENGKGGVEEIEFKPQQARYIRMQNVERGTDYGCSLWEFEVYGHEIKKNLAEQILVSTGIENNTIKYKSQEVQMQAIVLPENTTDKSVTWKVYNEDDSNTTLAKISKEGLLTAKENGIVKVVATAKDGSNITGECLVTVTNQNIDNIAINKTVIASSQANDEVKASQVNDGNLTTRWGAGSKDNNEFIIIDLGDSYYINQVILNWETAFAKKYKLFGSIEGQTYFELYNNDSSDGGVDNLILEEHLVRYVKMQGVERATKYGCSLWEFEIYGKSLKEELKKVYNEYKDTSESIYTPKSFSIFKDNLDSAKQVLDNPEATAQDVQNAETNLKKAYQSLVLKADKTALKTEIDQANSIDKSLYTPHSIETLNTILSEVQVIYDDDNATPLEVEAAVNKLQKILNSLTRKANKEGLKKVIDNAKNINENLYKPSSVASLKSVLEEVEKIYKDDNATESEVKEAVESLNKAIQKLVLIERDALVDLLKEVKGKDLTKYTEESVKSLQEAVDNAEKVLESTDQDVIDKAYKELKDALDAIILKGNTDYDIPTVDANEPVKNVIVGVKDINKVKDIITNSISKDLQEKINEKINNGKDIDTVVSIDTIDETKVNDSIKSDIEKITTFVNKESMKLAQYFDITIQVVADNFSEKISETKEKLTFQIAVPEELKKEGRIFKVVRIHDGEVTVLDAKEENGILTFESDQFSTYALTYTDKVETTITPNPTLNPGTGTDSNSEAVNTGDQKSIGLYVGIAMLSLLGMCLVKRRKEN